MLYDNAQLARVYLHAYQITGNEFYKRVSTEILDAAVAQLQPAFAQAPTGFAWW